MSGEQSKTSPVRVAAYGFVGCLSGIGFASACVMLAGFSLAVSEAQIFVAVGALFGAWIVGLLAGYNMGFITGADAFVWRERELMQGQERHD